MKPQKRIKLISSWIKKYAIQNKIETLVVGVSGGIDSSVVSTLCARTGLPTIAVSMPIKQSKKTHSLSVAHGEWLVSNFHNVKHQVIDLTPTFKQFEKAFDYTTDLGLANSRARLRMTTLYQIAQDNSGIVVGTGNKVEDFGVGFFTKYGDGGVDISPIGDCMKTTVWEMGKEMGILQEIINAPPTDGLWDDGRTDEDQLGMTYSELETCMLVDEGVIEVAGKDMPAKLKRYRQIRAKSLHKMQPIPVYKFD
jgi:NAD+ synthase